MRGTRMEETSMEFDWRIAGTFRPVIRPRRWDGQGYIGLYSSERTLTIILPHHYLF